MPQPVKPNVDSSQAQEGHAESRWGSPTSPPAERLASIAESAKLTMAAPFARVTCIHFSSGRMKRMAPPRPRRGPADDDSSTGSDSNTPMAEFPTAHPEEGDLISDAILLFKCT